MECRVGGKFRLGKKLYSSSFSDTFLGTNVQTGDEVAVKLETIKSKSPQLLFEAKLLKILAGCVGIPSVHWYGVEGEYNVMVHDLLGPSLDELFSDCKQKLSLKTVLMLADQMINRLECVHAKNFIHRNVKPSNFRMGLGKHRNQVFLHGFGFARKYRDAKTQQHIPYREGKTFQGTDIFASVNAHLGIESSRRDDLEAVGYALIHFCCGTLPWENVKAISSKKRRGQIMDKKMSTPVEVLCKHLPKELTTFLNYCRSLPFEDRPDYAHLRRQFKDLFFGEGYQYDYIFDWAILNGTAAKHDPSDTITCASSVPPTPRYWSNSQIVAPSLVTCSQEVVLRFQELFDATKRSACTQDRLKRSGQSFVPKNYKVLSVERIENQILWQTYCRKRAAIMLECETVDCDDCASVQTEGHTLEADELERYCVEVYVFHGTSEQAARKIANDGFDIKLAKNGLLGSLLYFADSCTKSDEYTGRVAECTMLVCRVVLGKHLYTAEVRPNKGDLCTKLQSGMHSVLADRCNTSGFCEYAVADPAQVYPEYLVTYSQHDEIP